LRSTRIVVAIPPESEGTKQRLIVAGFMPRLKPDPAVRKFFIKLKRPTLRDTTADLERLIWSLAHIKGLKVKDVGYWTLRDLPSILRAQDWKVTVSVFREQEIIKVEPGDKTRSCYGFAADIGTTKLAGYLVDLRTGKTISTVSSLNPQSKFGSDIISRITYSMSSPGASEELSDCIIKGLNGLIEKACEDSGLPSEDIVDVAVAGNTAMHHFLLGVSTRHLSLSPYPAALRRPMELRAVDLGLKTTLDSRVYIFPIVAGFVGGDAVADILATGMCAAEEMSLLVDIGTNAEIVLGTRNGLAACSCASGPAFEGSHIRHVLQGSVGALERLLIVQETLVFSYWVIGSTKPVGLCGSAIVEGVAEMLRVGIVDSRGRIQHRGGCDRVREVDGVREIVIVDKEEAGIDEDIVITQSDVREIQLAKAAIHAGISILMKHMHTRPSMIKRFFLAGAFGTYVDPKSACTIGMFPEIPLDRIRFVGNTAGSGARMALLSQRTRGQVDRILEKIRYVELGADPDFQREFVEAIDLPHARMELFPNFSRIAKRNLQSR
ncbi:MAG: ASKHA domain-containing protein, partial [Candidatus Bathyarchaeia archaeon]